MAPNTVFEKENKENKEEEEKTTISPWYLVDLDETQLYSCNIISVNNSSKHIESENFPKRIPCVCVWTC